MTYEEAKMQIQAIPEKIWDQLSEPDREAMEMAFSALQEQEAKAQLSAEGTTSDLISRQDALDEIRRFSGYLDEDMINRIHIGLNRLPSAQPESEERKAESAQNVPIEDLISRKAAIDAIVDCTVYGNADELEEAVMQGNDWNRWSGGVLEALESVKELPSVTPKCPECDDAVSREAAIDVAENAFVRGLLASPDIRKLPSVQPKPCEDAVSRADVVDMLEMFPFTEYSEYETAREVVKRLPSAKPERKKGKWIRITQGAIPEIYMCPFCNRTLKDSCIDGLVQIRYPFCHCGADMRGDDHDQSK